MAPAYPEPARFQTVLRLGSALAVLVRESPDGAGDRDALATTLLQRTTGRPDVAIRRRPSGRPCLAPPHCELGVSLARRHRLLVVGYSAVAPVGVDVEPDNGVTDIDATVLARDHFTVEEAAAVAHPPSGGARDLFLRLWVAKEAVLKATGRGIYDGLRWPNLATRVAALRAEVAIVEIAGDRRVTLAAKRVSIAAEWSVYCSLAVIEPASGRSGGVPVP